MPSTFDFEAPLLRNPLFIAAFKGWNDAAEASSAAIRFMVKEWSAHQIGRFSAEEYYDYTETRPRVRLLNGVSREIEWPTLRLYVASDEALPRDIVLLVGPEPQLRWPSFSSEILEMLQRLGVGDVVLLGSLLADVPHTRPARVFGTASDLHMRRRLDALEIGLSRYDGPTGIVGVLQDACGRAGISALSLWGNVPHYITASPNPQVSAALLRPLGLLYGLTLSVRQLEGQARRFRARVDEAIRQSPEAAAYVRELEEREGVEGSLSQERSLHERSPLPTGAEVVRDLEEFLRQQRSEGDVEGE